MEEVQQNIEEKKQELKKKLKFFLAENHVLIFSIIFILAFAIRIYFFLITKNQPLWWDEADYMAYAKTLAGAGNMDWIVTAKHNSLFPFIAAFFIKFISSEAVLRFILEVIPSLLLVFATYKILILMYNDKKIALISSSLMAVLWEGLFNTFRFHLDIPTLLVAYLSIYIFWQGYEKKEKIFGKINPKYSIPLTVFLVVLVYAM